MRQRVAIVGATGMLGHKLYLGLRQSHEVWALARRALDPRLRALELFRPDRYLAGLEISSPEKILAALNEIQADVVVNCTGLTTRKITPNNSADVVLVNSWFPRYLYQWAAMHRRRVIHFSTDCVFSGARGQYTEEDLCDARDLYGLSKALGEVTGPRALTLRGSLIGREILNKTELVEWFLAQRGRSAKGFRKTIYSGVTTNYMASLVNHILAHQPELEGLYQVSAPAISKFELLTHLNQILHLNIAIEPDDSHISDKSLISTRLFRALPEAEKPNWEAMLLEFKNEFGLYEMWAARESKAVI
jgi:dTDP-4-dehydrorhamnose reductase